MPADPRFYRTFGPLPVAALAPPWAEVRGDGARPIAGVEACEAAGPEHIAFVETKSVRRASAAAGALIMAPDALPEAPPGPVLIVTRHPRAAFASVAQRLFAPLEIEQQTAAIDPSAVLEPGVAVLPGCLIGPDVRIGAGTRLGPNAVIGPGVTIGRRAIVGAGVYVQCALIGDDVVIKANAVIGQAGFGVASGPSGPVNMPHLGRVILQDRVAIGALTAVDRGMLDDTVIGEDSKFDNLCQIAHNVRVGRGAMFASFAGISGSVVIGDSVLGGGRVGIADHLTVGDGASLGACAGLLQSVPAGETWSGFPAKPLRQWLREVALLRKLAGKRDG